MSSLRNKDIKANKNAVIKHIDRFKSKDRYYRNFSGDSLGQVEAIDVGDIAK